MDLSELQVFLTVAREGSFFTRRGAPFSARNPAVSLAIRKLEDDLGQKLFVRGRTARTPDRCRHPSKGLRRAPDQPARRSQKRGLSELEGLQRGELALGANESFHPRAHAPPFAKFRELHPAIQIRVHRMFSRDIPHEVPELPPGPWRHPRTWPARPRKLQATEIVKGRTHAGRPAKASAGQEARSGRGRTSARSRSWHTSSNRLFRRRVIELFARNRTVLNMAHGNAHHRKHQTFSCRWAWGVAIVPRMCVAWEIDHGWMKEVKVRQMNLPRHVYLVSRRGARLPHARRRTRSNPERSSGLVRGFCFCNRGEHWHQLQQAGHLHDGHPLLV